MNQVLKLLYITNGIDGSGGLERVLSIKASMLAEAPDYEVHIITLNQKGIDTFFPFSEKIQFHNLSVSGNPIQYMRAYRAALRHAVAAINPDLISVCDDGLKGFFVPRMLNNKYHTIYERHASVHITSGSSIISKLKNSLVHKLMMSRVRTFDRFVVLTEGNKKEWRGNNILVIPNPISDYPAQTADLLQKRVIAVGSQSYNKGYDRLLQSWALIQKIHPDWELVVYGKKNESLGLEQLATDLGIHNTVTFYDPVQQITEQYLRASIMVLPSRSEGFGMVLIEAMACGLPCVAYDCPHGPRDILTDNVDGYLIPDGDIEAFAQKIAFLMEHKERRQAFGTAALEKSKRYDPQVIVATWKDLFRSLVAPIR
ncbi:glycosyltransferase family 4 protein [Taibaiella sp. KBW10]|uniref:glycosyltransferase family 4 protein n=1 Tax=Taibaiella sp. KBW10 TaxID=2153357 RepID=UPI000F59DB0B|nr:glycosyltransferase family 4 protein [Taibaiella sp. KBW10]RQO31927.1 glycosyltransferase family 4 protein [Taibaiella sp. KBW10]